MKTAYAFFQLSLAFCILSCGPGETEPGTLVDHALWKPVPLESDPFKEYATEEVICPLGGYEVEGEGADQILEVDTGICNFVTLEQPLPRSLRNGDVLDWSMWHLTLVFAEPAEAFVTLTIGDYVLWEKTMLIPSPAAAYSTQLTVPADIDSGEPIRIHLHNHGNNSWRFHKLAVSE